MATRSLAWRDWGLSLSIPDAVAARLRRSRQTTQARPGGGLAFLDPPPTPHVQQRDLRHAMEFVQIAHEKGDEHALDAGFTGEDELTRRIRAISWYHTIELPGGVVTPGQFDHRALLPRYGLPPALTGQRALDVATFDGFWAFQLESLGAEVTAIDLDSTRDLDFPTRVRPLVADSTSMAVVGDGFRLAHEALQSKVTRLTSSVYDLSPDVHGTFDFVHCGDLLLHLRDPLTALERIRSVTTGTFLLSDVIDIEAKPGAFGPVVQYRGGWEDVVWWVPSLDALAQMVIDAGFSTVEVNCVYQLAKTYEDWGFWRASLTAHV